MANLLRMKADSIERAGKWRLIDDAAIAETVKKANKFKILIPIIETKLKGTNLQGIKPQDIKPQDTKPPDTKPEDKPTL